MKVLFIAAGTSPAGVFALAPLATAVRNAGHEIMVASFDELTPTIEAVGLPPVAVVTDHTTESIKQLNRPGGPIEFPWSPDQELPYVGRWFGRQAAVSLEGLLSLATHWRPDLVVGGTDAHAAGLLAAHLGVPHVRQAWDWLHFDGVERYANEELAPELALLGLDELPAPDLFLDICPPSLIPPGTPPGTPMRWVPGNRQRALEPWMYTPGERPRVCVTYGSFRTAMPEIFDHLCALVSRLTELDADIVVAANEEAAGKLRTLFPQVRSGWVPLEFLLPTCDTIVHSGGLTALNAMAAGTPQVVLNQFVAFEPSLRLLEQQGSSVVLHRGDGSPDGTFEACAKVLSDDSYARQARELARELGSMPTPNDVVADLEGLVRG
ncbi:nucleotide disphospho-sugar-binding domain-containing protein [Streptomyces purpureus]|uniref:DNTP-hexose glycosyl transferase n=1 Tax=Streptomyces purpureus TaxID=1951 RepID=A0A918GYY5_9ACTN|nr:nucleotide disphospho-sugar-binding domain-containing protein [Streptomyces purpureus]GGT19169.1 dNTP-hexose glycosyl transferase [Streptomyces purpureus]